MADKTQVNEEKPQHGHGQFSPGFLLSLLSDRSISRSLYHTWLPLLLPSLSLQPLDVGIHVNIGHCDPPKAGVQCVISNQFVLWHVSVFLLCFWLFTFKIGVKLKIFSSFACFSHDCMCFCSCNGHHTSSSSSSNPSFLSAVVYVVRKTWGKLWPLQTPRELSCYGVNDLAMQSSGVVSPLSNRFGQRHTDRTLDQEIDYNGGAALYYI